MTFREPADPYAPPTPSGSENPSRSILSWRFIPAAFGCLWGALMVWISVEMIRQVTEVARDPEVYGRPMVELSVVSAFAFALMFSAGVQVWGGIYWVKRKYRSAILANAVGYAAPILAFAAVRAYFALAA